MSRLVWVGLVAVALWAAPLAGCQVTASAPEVSVGWWYYPYHDVYFRDGLWWYYGTDGWLVVETLPPWLVVPPTAFRIRVELPPRIAPYRRWSDHEPYRPDHRPRPRVWRPAPPPRATPPRASHRLPRSVP